MFALLFYAGLATAQVTQSGCNCKSSTEVKWRLAGGKIGGGFSHYGCGTGPYEDRAPAQGRNWCDTQQSSCNGGQGWDFCNAPAPTPKSFKGTAPQEVNVNLGAVQQGQSTGATSNPGVTLSVNLNLGSSGSSSATPGAITTVQGCTCHPTSEVIMMQNGVRVGGGFSHTGCGTGPYEAYSPGKGSPWCDTVETWCASGWDLCVPPAGTSTTQTPSFPNPLPPQTPSYTANYNTMNSFTTAFGSTGSYQVPPTPFTMPPTPFVFPPTPPLYQAPLSPGYTEFPSSSAYTPPGPNNFNSNSYTSNSYTSNSYTSPAYTGTPSYTNTISNFNSNPSSYNAYTPVSAPVAGPAYSPPSYNSASSYTSSSYTASPAYTGSSYTPPVTTTRVTTPSTYASAYSPPASNFAATSTSVNVVPVPVARATATTRSPFANQRYPQRPGSRLPGKGLRGPPRGGRGTNDYDYDDSSSSSSSILPLMLMSKATGASTSSSLLPLMLATQSGGNNNNNMLPMMMMMQGSGSTGLSSSLTQLMMFNALRREGDGEAQNTTTLGEIGQELGFTRAVVSSGVTAADDDTAEAVEVQGGGGKVADDKEETDESDKGEEEHQEDKENEEEDEEEDAAAKEETDGDAATAPTASAPTTAAAVVAASPTAAAPTPADTTATTTPVDTRTLKGRKGPPASSDSSSSSP